MNTRHRTPLARIPLVLIGVAALVAPLLPTLPRAQAQVAPPTEACEALLTVADQLDDIADQINFNELKNVADFIRFIHDTLDCDGEPSPPPAAFCDALLTVADQLDDLADEINFNELKNVADFIRFIHDQLDCGADTPTTTTTTTTTTSTTTTTTVPADPSDSFIRSNDGRIRQVGQLAFEPTSTGTAHLELDRSLRRGYRIFGTPQGSASAEMRIERFDLDTLAEGLHRKYKVDEISLRQNSTTGLPQFGVVATTGDGHLYFVDSNQRIQKIHGETLERVASFAPPLLRARPGSSIPSDSDVGDNLEAIQQGRQFAGVGTVAGGLAYLEPHGELRDPKLLVLTTGDLIAEVGNIPNIVALAQIDTETGRTDWQANLGACRSRPASHVLKYGLGLAVSDIPGQPGRREAIIGCLGPSNRGEIWRVPLLPSGQGIEEEIHVENVSRAVGFLIDAEGRRVIVMTSIGHQFHIGVELDRQGVYGAVLAGLPTHNAAVSTTHTSAGIDPATGRVYNFTRHASGVSSDPAAGLLVVDARRRPMDQGLQFPELNPTNASARERIAVDPAEGNRPRRVFVPIRSIGIIRVFEDTIPVTGEASLADEDRFTTDVREEAGKTRAAFNASTSSYGARVLYAGGFYGLVTDEDALRNIIQNPNLGLFPACEPTTRELVLAQLTPRTTNLSDTGMSAEAVAAVVDERTRLDLDRPVAACWPTQGLFSNFDNLVGNLWGIVKNSPAYPVFEELRDTVLNTGVKIPSSNPDDEGTTVGNLLGANDLLGDGPPQWPTSPPSSAPDDTVRESTRDSFPFGPARCSLAGEVAQRPAPEGSPEEGEDDLVLRVLGTEQSAGPVPGFEARVVCGEDGGTLVGRAIAANAFDADDVISFEGAETTTIATRQAGGGVVVVTEAKTKGVNIADQLRIGEVRTRAVTRAAGRPGSATTRLERAWCGIVGLGQFDGEACQDVDNPAFQAGLEQFNSRLLTNFNLTLRVPPIDPDLAAGTPGGALAATQKDRFLVVGESFLNNDPRTEVPALEVIHVRDSVQGRARYLYQFAGVQASTAYNISTIPQFDFSFSLPSFDGPPTFAPPAPSAVLGTQTGSPGRPGTPGTARVVGAERASAIGESPPVATSAPQAVLQAIGRGLRWLLRNPWEALQLAMLAFTAWALPLHLHEKRRILGTAVIKRS